MTVFPKDNKSLNSASVALEETEGSDIQGMTEWTKVVEMEHVHAGKINGKHDSIDDKLRRCEERQNKEYTMDAEVRLKEEQLVEKEEKVVQEAKPEDNDAKPSHSYIALIAMAILSKPSKKVLLGDIYNYISEKFPFYRSKDKSWRNSIRHNLSLNECFIKAGRSENGKGNYWAIHPANLEDFANGDFRRRRARRRVRKNHSTLGTRYTSLPFPQHGQAFMNYRSAEFYHHHPFYITPFNMQNCVRKSSFAIDSLLSSRVPTVASPVEYTQVSSPLCSTALHRGYTTAGASYSPALTYPGMHTTTPYPIAFPSSNQVPTESWNDTWKKLKAQFQSHS